MILIDAAKEIYLRNPEELKNLRDIDFFSLQEIAQVNPLVFKYPEHIRYNKEKRIYKCGYLNEFYCYLFFYIEKNKWTKEKIFKFVTSNYDILIERRQFQKDIKTFKDNRDYYVLG